MIYWIAIAIVVALCLFLIGLIAGRQIRRSDEPAGPHISLYSPCPACGNIGCDLAFDPIERLVSRKCKHCGCVVRQPPVAPRLFEAKK